MNESTYRAIIFAIVQLSCFFSHNGPDARLTQPQQRRYDVVYGLKVKSMLLRIVCVLSSLTSGTKTRRVLPARAAGQSMRLRCAVALFVLRFPSVCLTTALRSIVWLEINYIAHGRDANYCDAHVCLSVCLSVCPFA